MSKNNVNVNVDVVYTKGLGKGLLQVKIKQTNVSLADINIDNKIYKVLRQLGNGKFIVKEIA